MFMCKDCHDKNESHSFESHLSGSHGPCEICGTVTKCVDCKRYKNHSESSERIKKKEQGLNPLASFLTLASGLDSHLVPSDDAEDVRNGASHIPYEVTNIRRGGEKVRYLGNNKWEYKDRIIT